MLSLPPQLAQRVREAAAGSIIVIEAAGDAVEVSGQAKQAIAAMSRLLTALLDISKLESGAIGSSPCSLHP